MIRHIIFFCCAFALLAAAPSVMPAAAAAVQQMEGASGGERRASANASARKKTAVRAKRKAAYHAARSREAAARTASPSLRQRYAKPRKTNRFRNGEHVIAQIPPRLRSSGSLTLDAERHGCRARRGKHSACSMPRQRTRYPDMLLEASTAETAAILEGAGIPTVKDVPPVVIIFPERPRGDERFLGAIR